MTKLPPKKSNIMGSYTVWYRNDTGVAGPLNKWTSVRLLVKLFLRTSLYQSFKFTTQHGI